MSAPLLVDDVVIDRRWSDRASRRCGDHPLFTPLAEDVVVPRLVAVPPPVAAECTSVLPRLGPDGLPVTHHVPETSASPVENVTGWSDIDRKLHAINTSLGPISPGLWWSDCDRTVEFIPAREVAQIGEGAWCRACWSFDTNGETGDADEE